jgi:hypothetical protein
MNLWFNFLHLIGFALLIAGIAFSYFTHRLSIVPTKQFKIISSVFHGTGLLILLVTGFMLLSQLNIGIPNWISVKILLWFLWVGFFVLIKRTSLSIKNFLLILLLLTIATLHAAVFRSY